MKSPEQIHARRHPRSRFEDCWDCGKERAVCRSKIRFNTRPEAQEWIDALNIARHFVQGLVRYRCIWCTGWHMRTAKDRWSKARLEKQRRKLLAKGVLRNDGTA